jgi:hypothetical protein
MKIFSIANNPGSGIAQSVYRLATGWTASGEGGRMLSPGRGRIFLLSTSFRPVVGSTQRPIQRVPGE